MTNFKCVFCNENMEIPKSVKKEISPVTHAVWHDECVDNPKYELTDSQRVFYHSTGQVF